MKRGKWLSDMKLWFLLWKKRLGLTKIKNKIGYSLFGIGVFAILMVGGISYGISRKAIIENSEVMVNNLMKQVGLNLDERINSFQDVSYRIVQNTEVARLLDYAEQEILEKRITSYKFSDVILQQSSLYSYTKYALLESAGGVVFRYYKPSHRRMTAQQEQEILDALEKSVTRTNPVGWAEYGGEVYFVRKIISDKDYSEKGLLCFAMTDKFLDFFGESGEMVENENLIILNSHKEILRNYKFDTEDEKIRRMIEREKYYIYNQEIEYQGNRYLCTNLNTADSHWRIISFIPLKILLEKESAIFKAIIIAVGAAMILALLLTWLLSSTITKNIRIVEQGMQNFEKGNFHIRIKPAYYDEIGQLAMQMNYMGMKISGLMTMVEKEQEAKQRAEYQTLQAQINPHFLYNTLGSLKWAAFRRGERETSSMADAIINLLKYTIKRKGQFVPLHDEIEYIKNYVYIEKMRYGDSFEAFYEVERELEACQVPGFILQPFVENSLLHGIDMAKGDGRIAVRAYQRDGLISIEVEDNGIGFPEERLQEIMKEEKNYTGFNSIGIKIVDERLKSYYGSSYHLEIKSTPETGTLVRLVIPFGAESEEGKSVEDTGLDRRR